MKLQRRLILVLFVDKELALALFVAVHLEHQASGLFAGFLGESAEDPFGLRFLPNFRFPNNCQNDHLFAGCANISSLRFFICSGVTSSMCCAIDQ